MNALLCALANLARLRWLGVVFCVLAIVCATNVNANTNAIASGAQQQPAKTRVGGFEQNPPLNVCANAAETVETHRGISNAQCETASAFSHAAEGGTILSGHGELVAGEFSPVLQVPEGTSITVWTGHGGVISDALGNAIETGGPINMSLYPEIEGAQTYLPGSFMPNYTLSPPTGLNIMGSPITIGAPTQLSGLVQPGMGNVQWAACLFCSQ